MKKLLMILLALTMISSCALAETTTGTVTDFEDFTMVCDPNYVVFGQKQSGDTWFTVYPAMGEGDTATNFNCVWGTDSTDITVLDDILLGEFLDVYAGQLRQMHESMGLTVNEVKLVGFDRTTIDGAGDLHCSPDSERHLYGNGTGNDTGSVIR